MGGPPPKRRERMKLEDMKVGAFVKCTKPEWECYGDIFEITKELPDNEWEITRIPFWQRRESGKGIKSLRTTFVIKQKILQHNFKIDKVIEQAHINMLPSKAITINIRFDKTTTAESMGKKVTVGLYHEDKYDEFVGAVEALAKLYGRKSPFDEIEKLKEAARAAEEPIEATEVSDEWSTVEKEEPTPHSPVDDMDLTPPLEVGCLIKLKNPYTDKLKGKWFRVTCIGTCLGYDTAVIPVFLEPNKMSHRAFNKDNFEVVCERYRNIWDSELKYQFGDRVVLTQTGFNVKRKSYGTVIDWRQYNNENYYIVHWDDEDARFIEQKEELIPEYCLLPVRYE